MILGHYKSHGRWYRVIMQEQAGDEWIPANARDENTGHVVDMLWFTLESGEVSGAAQSGQKGGACERCGGSGAMDSGATEAWGKWIEVPCDLCDGTGKPEKGGE